MIDKENIAGAIKRYRVERDLTIDAIAQIVGVSISTIQKWENGTHKPQDRQLFKLLNKIPGLVSVIDR